MARKLLLSLAFAAAAVVRGEPEANTCPDGGVRFEGRATFEDNEKPKQLSRGAVLTIEVAEETKSGEEPKAPIYTHNVPLEKYSPEKDITYSFCSDLSSIKSKKVSLKAHVLDQSDDDKVEYIGETVVTAGSDTYEADLTLAKVEHGANSGEPSVADCQFGEMPEDMRGIAVRVNVKINYKNALPKPTYLAVSLREIDPETGEPEVVSVFAGDISGLYEPGKPVPAFLCAKVPISEEPVKYTLDASVHMGWNGFVSAEDDERTPRKGDLVSKRHVDIEILPDEQDYLIDMSMKPFDARA